MTTIDTNKLSQGDREILARVINERLCNAIALTEVMRMRAAAHHFGVPKACKENIDLALARLNAQRDCQWTNGDHSLNVVSGKVVGMPMGVADLAAEGWVPCLTA